MSSSDSNRALLNAFVRDKRRSLSKTDSRSLIRSVNGLSDLGNDFLNYRNEHLHFLPNTVITGLCHVLKELGVKVYLPREADRYNEIATYCIQETWNSSLGKIFKCAKFFNMKRAHGFGISYSKFSSEELYNESLGNIDNGDEISEVVAKIVNKELTSVTHVVVVKSDELSVVASFEKRSSANKLLAYAARREGESFFSDTRLRLKAKHSCSRNRKKISGEGLYPIQNADENITKEQFPFNEITPYNYVKPNRILLPSIFNLMEPNNLSSFGKL